MSSTINESDAKDISKGIRPLERIRYANLSGRSKRKLIRQNTVHLNSLCPNCGSRMRYNKNVETTKATGNGNPVYDHDKWVCKKCGKRFSRNELEYIKYD